MIRYTPAPDIESAFMNRVFIRPKGCWLYQRRGAVQLGPKPHRSPRIFAWQLRHGPIPTGMRLVNHCGSSRCCNPDHMKLRPIGERLILSDKSVQLVRAYSEHRGWSKRQILRTWGITSKQYDQIMSREVRADLPDLPADADLPWERTSY